MPPNLTDKQGQPRLSPVVCVDHTLVREADSLQATSDAQKGERAPITYCASAAPRRQSETHPLLPPSPAGLDTREICLHANTCPASLAVVMASLPSASSNR